MSVLKKAEEIACFIQQKYPTMEFDSIGVSHEEISDICNVIFKKGNCNKVKNNLVMALKNPNSALRKLLHSKTDIESHFCTMLKDNGYSKKDFSSYKTEVVNSVCKLLKININRKNQHRIFRRCQKSFR